MIEGVIGNKPLPANIRQDIIERTDGIPLFVEERRRRCSGERGRSAAEPSRLGHTVSRCARRDFQAHLRSARQRRRRPSPAPSAASTAISSSGPVVIPRRDANGSALKYVVHFIGDVHQPLHASNNDDRGGNDVAVTFMGHQTNLHAVWDNGIIGPAVKGEARLHYGSRDTHTGPESAVAGNAVSWANA